MGRGFWKHDAFLDVEFLVLKIQYSDQRYYKVRGEWWVRGTYLGIKQTIKIMRQDLYKWKRSSGK